LWALGVVLYQMALGRLPFQGDHAATLIQSILHGDPLSSVELPAPLAPILRKSLARQRWARYRDTGELLADLLKAQQGGSISASSRANTEGERRQVSVLQALVQAATAEGQALDPELLLDVPAAFRVLCEKVVARFEGETVSGTSDAVVICYGYPLAHEDDTRRAAASGLAIIEAVQHWSFQPSGAPPLRLSVRIGIDTGLVIAKHSAGSITLVGQPPNAAAALQALAPADGLVVSSATQRLIQRAFVCRAAGTYAIAGHATPQAIYQVSHESGARNRLDSATDPSVVPPMVGREQELALLLERWRQVVGGQGQVVLISGEAGIGKSRLVRALRETVAAHPQAWLTLCQCSPYHRNSALYPIIDTLEHAILQFGDQDSAARRLEKLEGFLLQFGLREAVAPLAALLSLPLDTALPMSPERQRQQTLEALLQLLLERAARQPLLLVIEDLHWADPTTLEWLNLLIDQEDAAPILTVLTYRPDFRPPWIAANPHLNQLVLGHLNSRQIQQMVERLTASGPLPQYALEQILARTDGVPLFVEEMTQALLETSLDQADIPIPATLQASLSARLDRLGRAKAVAQLGAVLGREFSFELLKSVTDTAPALLLKDLHDLVAAGLLHRRGLMPKVRYVFKHALVQEAAYQSLLKSRRRSHHRRIAEVLESQASENGSTDYEKLAYHWLESGEASKAIIHWQQAGHQALRRAANVEAIAHFRQALTTLQGQADSPAKRHQELGLQLALGPALTAIQGFAAPAVQQAYSRARTLCQQAGDQAQLFPALWGLWTFHFVKGELGPAFELAREVESLTLVRNDPISRLMAHHALGFTHYYRAEFEEALYHAEQGLALHDPAEERALALRLQFSSTVALLAFGGSSLWMLGYPDRAWAMSQRSLDLARRLAHPPSLGFALSFATWFHAFRQEAALTLKTAEEALSLATEQRFALWQPIALFFRGWAICRLGDSAAGLPQMRDGYAGYRATGTELIQPHMLALLAEMLAANSATDEALQWLEDAIAQAERREEHHYEPELWRLKGVIYAALAEQSESLAQTEKRRNEAESCLHQALRLAQQQRARVLELRAAVSLAELWDKRGRRDEARSLVEEKQGWFTEGFATLDLHRSQTLLNRLASPANEQ
jgi:class 3 adenylate cyclase/predicted ATPase